MSVSTDAILSLCRQLHPRQVRWRRHLHEHPEISNEEFKTTEFLRRELTKLKVKFLPVKTRTGLLVDLRGEHDGPTVAIRTDIDALPVLEQTGLPFASRHSGRMHACGHDVHMATVLGTAAVLARLRRQIHGTVRFIFQPAEEMPPGGARPMIAGGALKDVAVIFGLHVDPDLAVGKIGLRDGATMAAVYDFDITVRGKTGHAAKPHSAIDAIATAAEIVDSIQKVVSRETDPIDPVVITFGQIFGGTARNIIADTVQLIGTARTLSERAEQKVPALIKKTAEGIARARGAGCEITPIANYPVLRNDPAINRMLADSFTRLFGAGKTAVTPPVLGGEDFACYLEEVPGAMLRLGVMNKKIHADQPWHSPKFVVDESAMLYGTAVLVDATLQYLESRKL